MKYGNEIFKELHDINTHGMEFGGIHHQVLVVCCCDWKAGACIEGELSAMEIGQIFEIFLLLYEIKQ